jgi:hypothetical protein
MAPKVNNNKEISVHLVYLEQYAQYVKNPEKFDYLDERDIEILREYFCKGMGFFSKIKNDAGSYSQGKIKKGQPKPTFID